VADQSSSQNTDLAALWEQMGISTGGFIGRIIGLTAQFGLQAYQQTVIDPLQKAAGINAAPPVETEIPTDIRTQTWREMGKEYGESIGMSIGIAMDSTINSLKAAASTGIPGFNGQPPDKKEGPS